jgi:hypothetical protein
VYGLDLLTLMLVAGVVVLVISTTAMVMTMTPTARERRRSTPHPLSPSAAHAVALARAAAATHTVDDALTARALGEAGSTPTGQIIDISDGRLTGRGTATEMTVEYAQALAEHVAETDPQFVAEVISQWIRADSSDLGVYR